MAKIHKKGGAGPVRTNRYGDVWVGVATLTIAGSPAVTVSPAAGLTATWATSLVTIVFEDGYAPTDVIAVLGNVTDADGVAPADIMAISLSSYTASTGTLVIDTPVALLAVGDVLQLTFVAVAKSL